MNWTLNYIPPNTRLINLISKRFTSDRWFTSNELSTWVDLSQDLMLISTVCFLTLRATCSPTVEFSRLSAATVNRGSNPRTEWNCTCWCIRVSRPFLVLTVQSPSMGKKREIARSPQWLLPGLRLTTRQLANGECLHGSGEWRLLICSPVWRVIYFNVLH